MKAKKKILSLLLAIAMILGMLPMTAMPVYAANSPASLVTLTTSEGEQTLDSQYPYLVNNKKATTGTLNGSTCTAYFDSTTGTLTLHNYNGKSIGSGTLGGAQDLTVKLKGANTIDGSLENKSGGDILITADSAATLSITQSGDTSQTLAGIATQISGLTTGPGSITIGGKAAITISVTNTNTGDSAKARGIFAKQGILIKDNAALDITCVAHSQVASGGAATGIYTGNQKITFNTTGTITVDCSNNTNLKSLSLRSYGNILTKVGTMTLKYTTGGGVAEMGGSGVTFNTGAFVKSKPDATTENYTPGPMTVNLTPGDGKVTLTQASSEAWYVFAYTTSTSSVTAPQSGSDKPTGVITVPVGGSVDITATNGTEIFVQVYKLDGGTNKVYGFGEASAIPTAGALAYALTVVNGTGGGSFAENAVVNIAATVPGGKVFKQWESSGGGTFASATSPSTTFTMPAEAVTVTATFEDAPSTTYLLTVEGGTGGGSFAENAVVNIAATVPGGKVFKQWESSGGGTFASATSANTTFTMPAEAVTVTATFEDAPSGTYSVTISGGGSGATGAGSYAEGVTVSIYAGNYSGYTFTGWTSGDVTITNPTSKTVSFTMPAKNVTVKANWTYSSGSGGGGGSSSSSTNATLSDTKAEFDKNEGDDLKVTLKSGSYSLRSIRNGSYTLEEGRDYTISGGTVTIKASYLDSLKEGKHYLTFDMNGGIDPVLTIIVSETTVVTDTTETDTQDEKPTVEVTAKFEDVKSGDWFYDAVNYIYNAGLMVGTSDTTFSPYTNTTRGMIVTILHTLEGSPMPNTTNGFTDVGADKYYTDAVAWASANKIVSGYGNGIFSPDNSITREQMAVILMNYAQYKGYDVSTRADLSKFADGEYISPWAKDAMSWANAEGLMQGSGNQLMPADNAQRCQVAAILQSFLERIAK